MQKGSGNSSLGRENKLTHLTTQRESQWKRTRKHDN